MDLVRSIFLPHKAASILKIPISFRLLDDQLVWIGNKRGSFTVKSAYYIAMRMIDDQDLGECSVAHSQTSFWKAIWHLNTPPKIRIFAWKVCRIDLPTMLNLRCWGQMSQVSAQSVIRKWSLSNMLCFFALMPNLLGLIGQITLQAFHPQMHPLWTLFLSSLIQACLQIWLFFSLSFGQYGGIEIKPFLGTLHFRQPWFGTLQKEPTWILLMLGSPSPLLHLLPVPIGLLPLPVSSRLTWTELLMLGVVTLALELSFGIPQASPLVLSAWFSLLASLLKSQKHMLCFMVSSLPLKCKSTKLFLSPTHYLLSMT